MTTERFGSTAKYAANWEKAFGKSTPSAKSPQPQPAKKKKDVKKGAKK